MQKLKRNDTVKVLTGRDKGKSGKILQILPHKNCALVEGVNFIKKHIRQTKQDQKGGIIQKESPVKISNLILVCKNCGKPSRVGFKIMSDGASRARMCRKCKEIIT